MVRRNQVLKAVVVVEGGARGGEEGAKEMLWRSAKAWVQRVRGQAKCENKVEAVGGSTMVAHGGGACRPRFFLKAENLGWDR